MCWNQDFILQHFRFNISLKAAPPGETAFLQQSKAEQPGNNLRKKATQLSFKDSWWKIQDSKNFSNSSSPASTCQVAGISLKLFAIAFMARKMNHSISLQQWLKWDAQTMLQCVVDETADARAHLSDQEDANPPSNKA